MSDRSAAAGQIFDDLEAEQDQLDGLLSGLPEHAWHSRSQAAGWTVTDVVLHLAQTEEVVATASTSTEVPGWRPDPGGVDELMSSWWRRCCTALEVVERTLVGDPGAGDLSGVLTSPPTVAEVIAHAEASGGCGD